MIQIYDPLHFFEIQKKIDTIPFNQSKGWYDYLKSKNSNIHFFVDDEKDTKIALWGRVNKIPLFGGNIIRFDGESYLANITEKVFTSFFSELSKLSYKGIELNSNNVYCVEFEVGLRRAGFIKPITFSSCPLTIIINFAQEFNFDRNWKRNVKKAENRSLIFSEIEEGSLEIVEKIVSMFREMAKLKKLSYKLEANSLLQLLNSNEFRTFFVYDSNMNALAARIIHEYNGTVSDVYASNSVSSRDLGATYYIMDRLLRQLKSEGKKSFDFSRIPPSNHSTDSVYIYKNASRGTKTQYNGEWVKYNNVWLEYLLHIYKRLVLKNQRY